MLTCSLTNSTAVIHLDAATSAVAVMYVTRADFVRIIDCLSEAHEKACAEREEEETVTAYALECLTTVYCDTHPDGTVGVVFHAGGSMGIYAKALLTTDELGDVVEEWALADAATLDSSPNPITGQYRTATSAG